MCTVRALFIGGTGIISAHISQLAVNREWDLTLLTRSGKSELVPDGTHFLKGDIQDEAAIAALLQDFQFDVIADFIAFGVPDLERDWRLFKNRTKQFIYISTASAYQKPLSNYIVNERTPLANPFWKYSRDKIAGEEFLMARYREDGFPITIVRPSHTYCERKVPVAIHGHKGSWQTLKRMLAGKSVLIHGDGSSLWTMTHSADFAKGFVGLMGNPHTIGEAVQITSDESMTWNQIYGVIADALNVPLKATHISSDFISACAPYNLRGNLLGDKANTLVFDNTKIKRLVPDFTPTIGMKAGLTEAVLYALTHPECQTEDPEFDFWCDKVIAALETATHTIQNSFTERKTYFGNKRADL